jgi:TolB-like protein/Flp pilus assembly protein TadD/predicted Ser/Thr protein kinase
MALSRSQMARMNALLEQALTLDFAGRRRWLQELGPEHCDLEPALRRALLAATDADGLDTLPKLAPTVSMKPGDLVGPYRLMHRLGVGGMAQVWLAERADGAFKKEVALKAPAVGRERHGLAERFAVERDILAALEHPNIARFYDAGVSSDGLPYIALEYVAGRNLLTWADEHRLGVRDRIDLFLQVLEAVHYAHSKGVLHRDIKPSNVLVTDQGQVRLLDFGVAKLLDHPEACLTLEYGRALTPEYASPEQIEGRELEAASDVYSLGVLLYELMCGSRPARSAGRHSSKQWPSASVDEAAATARGTTASRLQHLLRGDLDAVVTKALAADPVQRYVSASAFAQDLQRYLHGKPLASRPATFTYRFRKFIERHRVAVLGTVTASALFLALETYTLTHGLRQAPPPTSLPASSNAAGSDAVSDKSIAVLPFVDMSEKHDQEYFSDGLSEELIDRLTHSPDLKVIARTSAFAFKGKNEDVRSIAGKLGVTHLLEGSVRKSGKVLRIRAELVRASDGVHLWSQTYDRNWADIFKVQDDIARTVAGSLNAALTVDQSRSSAVDPNAYNLSLRARYLFRRKTRQALLSALQTYQRAAALDPKYADAWVGISRIYASLGGNGWLGTAEAGTKARDAAERAIRIDPSDANAYNALGKVFFGFDGNWASAQANFRRASELMPDSIQLAADAALIETSFGRFDRRIEYEKKLVRIDPLDSEALNALNEDLFLAGRYEEAIEVARQAIRLDPTFAGAHAGLAWPLLFLRSNDEALNAALQETDDNWRLSTLPAVYWALGRRAESDKALQELGARFSDVSAYNVGEMYAYRGEADMAFQWLERAYRQQDTGLQQFRVDPYLLGLRNDQRYRALLVRLKLDGDPPS